MVAVSIRHCHWKQRQYVRKVLPPPVRCIDTDSRHVHVTIDKAWREIAERYYAQVPLPLPFNASAQNLVLYLLHLGAGRPRRTAQGAGSLRQDRLEAHAARNGAEACRRRGAALVSAARPRTGGVRRRVPG